MSRPLLLHTLCWKEHKEARCSKTGPCHARTSDARRSSPRENNPRASDCVNENVYVQGGVRAENTDPLAQWPGHSEDKHAESSFTKNTGAHVVWILQSGEAGCSMARPSSWGLPAGEQGWRAPSALWFPAPPPLPSTTLLCLQTGRCWHFLAMHLNLLMRLIWREAFLPSKLDAETNAKDTMEGEFH